MAATAERFERLLVAKIGAERAPKAIKTTVTAPGFETAEGRLSAQIDSCEPQALVEPAAILEPEPATVAAPIVKTIEAKPELAAAPSVVSEMPT